MPKRAQALAFATAVNLSGGDIPEASVAPRSTYRSTPREKQEYRACERGVPHERALLAKSSPMLERGKELEVEVFASGVAVVADERSIAPVFRALQSAHVRNCLAEVFTRHFSQRSISEARWGRFSFAKLPLSAPGASSTFGIRVSGALNIPYNEISVPIYVDMLGIAVGHSEVTLIAGSATQPVPATTEGELVNLLLARAKAHSL